MKAAVFHAPHDLEIVSCNTPSFGDDELLVRVNACGVCGTDFHIYSGEAPAKAPVIIGHEYAGEVADIGRNVSGFRVGDKVAINPNIHCGYCEYCRTGRINLCKNLKALGVTLNGGFAQLSVLPQSQAYYIPNDFPIDLAAFSEPVSCCLHGIDQADIKLSDTVAIIGAGTIGLIMLQLARLKGAKKIVIIEPLTGKRNIAASLKADDVLNPLMDDFNSEFQETLPGGADIVIECVGNPSAAETALRVVKKGGTIVIFGLSSPSAKIELPLQTFFHKELTIKSSLLNPNTFQTAVDLIVSRKINVEVITHSSLPLDKKSLQFLFSDAKDNSVIKYIIKPN